MLSSVGCFTKCLFIWFLPRDALGAERNTSIVFPPSPRLSVRPSVTLKYRGRIGWDVGL